MFTLYFNNFKFPILDYNQININYFVENKIISNDPNFDEWFNQRHKNIQFLIKKRLDQIAKEYVEEYIKNNDAGLILVTHEHELANRCDKVYKLEDLTLQEIK